MSSEICSTLKTNQPGPCAKKQVWAVLVTKDNELFMGMNLCRKAQTVCPRESGEGYAKCHTICETMGHAEEIALELAGSKARSGKMYIGHHRICIDCQVKMMRADVDFEAMETKR